MQFEILPMKIEDYEEVIALWRASDFVGLSDADSREGIDRFLRDNPGLNFIARGEGSMLGAVICGCDGRRGYLHHLAVDQTNRKQGVGKALVTACISALAERGIQKCHIFVYANNQPGIEFWKRIGWKHREELILMSRNV